TASRPQTRPERAARRDVFQGLLEILVVVGPVRDVGHRDDAEQAVVAVDDGYAAHLALAHGLDHLRRRLLGRDRFHVGGHHVAGRHALDLPPFGDRPNDDVTVGHDPLQDPLRVDHRDDAGVLALHQRRDVEGRRLGRNGPRIARHDVARGRGLALPAATRRPLPRLEPVALPLRSAAELVGGSAAAAELLLAEALVELAATGLAEAAVGTPLAPRLAPRLAHAPLERLIVPLAQPRVGSRLRLRLEIAPGRAAAVVAFAAATLRIAVRSTLLPAGGARVEASHLTAAAGLAAGAAAHVSPET